MLVNLDGVKFEKREGSREREGGGGRGILKRTEYLRSNELELFFVRTFISSRLGALKKREGVGGRGRGQPGRVL